MTTAYEKWLLKVAIENCSEVMGVRDHVAALIREDCERQNQRAFDLMEHISIGAPFSESAFLKAADYVILNAQKV